MLAVPSVTIAQVAETSGLYKQIMRADGKLFHDRFNNCKLDELDTLISDNFHFIHDQNGSQSRSGIPERIQGQHLQHPGAQADPEGRPWHHPGLCFVQRGQALRRH